MIEHPDYGALAAAVARVLARQCRAAIATRGSARLALAGGNTPLPIYCRLAEESIDWARVIALPTDERWVDGSHPASNLRALQMAFDKAVGVRWLSLAGAATGSMPNLETARQSLAVCTGPFDAVLLGMGEDGHIASLFPGNGTPAAVLTRDSSEAVAAVYPEPLPAAAPFVRISLTLSRLLRTRLLLLVITGECKRALLCETRVLPLPVDRLLQAAGNAITIHWSPA